jgi:uncharacterized membrane protein
VKLSYLLKGTPGHPSHPPLTDATIGTYTFATVSGVLGALGLAEESFAVAWWLALILGLIVNAPTSLTGLADYLEIPSGTPLRRTATIHLLSMVTATAFFGLAAIFGHDAYEDREVSGGALALTLVGFGFLTLGGWIGGSIVYVHGMRVLELVREPTRRAVAPVTPEKEAASEGEAPPADPAEPGR